MTTIETDPAARAELCRCGHSRGNHRWFAVNGKHRCYFPIAGDTCECPSFIGKALDEVIEVKP